MTQFWIVIGLPIILSLLVNELSDLSPWLARRFVARAAIIWARDDAARSDELRAEWGAIIEDAPGKITKLVVGLRFLVGAVARNRVLWFTGDSAFWTVLDFCFWLGRTSTNRLPARHRVRLVKWILWTALRVPGHGVEACGLLLGNPDFDALRIDASREKIVMSFVPRTERPTGQLDTGDDHCSD
jgi:hypothetical protein